MIKNKSVTTNTLSLLLVLVFALFLTQGCGKKDGSTTGDNKDSKTDSKKDDNFSPDKPFMVEFQMSGATNGTVNAVYSGKKCRSQSSIEMAGMKTSATAYFNGGDTVYMVSELAGKKTGMKFSKSDMSKKKDDVDITSFKDKLKEMDKIGSEEILGKKCDIYRAKDSSYSISVYNETVPLKFSTGHGKMMMVATKYETDVKVSDDMFNPPADVKFTDSSNMMKDMKDMKDSKNMDEMKKQMEDVMKNYKK